MKKISDAEKWSMLAESNASCAVSELSDKSKEKAEKITSELGVAYMIEVVAQLSSDAAVDLLRNLPEDFCESIVKGLPEAQAKDLREILQYPAGTAGSMMAKEFLHIPVEMNVAEAIEFLHLIPKERKGKVSYIYVVDKDKRLKGVVQTRDLVFNSLEVPIKEILKAPVVSVKTHTGQEETTKTIQSYRFLAVPVLDDDDRLVGIVSADNVLQAMKEQADKDIAKMIGTSSEEMKAGSGSIPAIMRVRLPWLFVNIVSGLFCAYIAGLFEHGPKEVLALFLFIPVVLGLSESTGIQGATIVVRNLTLGKVSFKDFGSLFLKEIIIGILIGLVCGIIVGFVTSLWQGNAVLGVAMAVSLNIAIIVSALIGLLLPLVFKSLRIDPAMASGPLVLAICDIQTLFVYFNLAGFILRTW